MPLLSISKRTGGRFISGRAGERTRSFKMAVRNDCDTKVSKVLRKVFRYFPWNLLVVPRQPASP